MNPMEWTFPRLLNLQRCSLLILTVWTLFYVPESAAQGSFLWSQQQRIPEYYPFTEEPPYLIADRNHTVHAFNSQPIDLSDENSTEAVFYRQWTLEQGWTFPNDILFDNEGADLNLLGADDDSTGRVHLVLQKDSDVYYVSNYLAVARTPGSWPAPVIVGANAERARPGVENVAAISASEDGQEIVIIYSGSQIGNGLYFTHSSTAGNTWSQPYPIYLTDNETIIVTDPKLFAGESGRFHAVWASFLQSGAAGPGYYANYDQVTGLWSEPMALDTPGIRTPAIIETQEMVLLSYHHISTNGNWWRRSIDGGKTWSPPERISARHVGTNGALSFAVDGANTLHAFFGERMNDQNHGMWHISFNGTSWSYIEAVVRAPQRISEPGGDGFDPRSARAVIVNGNKVLVTWGTDGAAGINGAWFSYKRLDAPELPTIALPVPEEPSEVVPAATAAAVEAATIPVDSVPTFDFGEPPPSFVQNPQTSILAGVVPALLILAATVLTYFILHYHKQ